jgi:alpha-galactosidase
MPADIVSPPRPQEADRNTAVVSAGRLQLHVAVGADEPAAIERILLDGRPVLGRSRLVELQVDGELHTRVGRGYRETAGGARLRPSDHRVVRTDDGAVLVVDQHDASTGLRVTTDLLVLSGAAVIRARHRVANAGARAVSLRAVSSLSLATPQPARSARYTVVAGRSDWLGEGRWSATPLAELLPDLDLPFYGQSSRGRFAQTGTGAWTTSELLPVGLLQDEAGGTIAWQIESGAGWHWELADDLDAVRLLALGPTDAEHQGAVVVEPGAAVEAAPAAVALGSDLDDAVAGLTSARRSARRVPVAELPVVYNDYMNTLMGQPSTEALLPLIAEAASAGAEVFCIDAGWFAEPGGDYWAGIGDWRPAKGRFTGGLRTVIDAIRGAGMTPGLWLEPEAVGMDSVAWDELPPTAFFQRDGLRVVEQRRGHLDFTRPEARRHLDAAIDRLVHDFGVGYLKLDYNIDPGVGTDRGEGLAPGRGLLEHARAYADWVADLPRRHPGMLVETCASGAMRSDPALLAVAHLQSTSDQQNARHSVPIAASAPLMMAPEQAGDWAYPAADMSDGETALTLACGLAGRLYLSGFLDRLRPEQRSLVHEAVALHKRWRPWLGRSTPRWPLGLPAWTGAETALILDAGEAVLLLAWSRGDGGAVTVELPRPVRPLSVFPAAEGHRVRSDGTRVSIELPTGPAAIGVLLRAGEEETV